jgi:hypothetical protein
VTDVDNFLEHYGVKGMRWGVRKAATGVVNASRSANAGVKDAIQRVREKRAGVKADRKANFEAARNRGYSEKMRRVDLEDVGSRRTRRIEKRIADGEKIGVARFKERALSMAEGMAVGTAILATPLAIGATSVGLSNLASNINAKRGAEAARNLLADTKGLTSYSTVALSFNAAKGIWE